MAPNDSLDSGELLERGAELDALDMRLAAVRESGRGRMLLIGGEAGIGKTALVRSFCAQLDPRHVLAGACDALFTPRPLGPLIDIAEDAGGELAAAAAGEPTAATMVAALQDEMLRRRPAV